MSAIYNKYEVQNRITKYEGLTAHSSLVRRDRFQIDSSMDGMDRPMWLSNGKAQGTIEIEE